ncbi:hypothetical protein B0181_02310 [Moraxella caviae]|uniref:Uncharacterized protein n=1 Tax=Moraxella caviae TaxID=34060 RepID=A0A1T0A812_9GAMM|nr:hypothetical protein B0181_02310 [Moraxella caviae]
MLVIFGVVCALLLNLGFKIKRAFGGEFAGEKGDNLLVFYAKTMYNAHPTFRFRNALACEWQKGSQRATDVFKEANYETKNQTWCG